MDEQQLLDFLLGVTLFFAPRMTAHFFLPEDAVYRRAHALAFVVVVGSAGVGMGAGVGAVVWAAFCVLGVILYVRRAGQVLRSWWGAASVVPFVFSMVSAVWLVGARSDLRLLGYDAAWSSYAALHGGVLGWLFVGCVVEVARRPHTRALYLWSCFVFFALFLCVAFGIDGVPYAKRIGVVGLSVMVPGVIACFTFDARGRNSAALLWSLLSLVVVVATMALALAHEFSTEFPRVLWGLPTMVVLHGVLNTVVVVPAFYAAVSRGLR